MDEDISSIDLQHLQHIIGQHQNRQTSGRRQTHLTSDQRPEAIIIRNSGGDSRNPGGDPGGDSGGDPGRYITRAEFIQFKSEITIRFDNLFKGYGRLEGKYDAFNQIWRQQLQELKDEFNDIKEELKSDINRLNTSVTDGFRNLEELITRRNSEAQ